MRASGASLQIRLISVGFGGALEAAQPTVPVLAGGRATYLRKGLREWYANGPLGLEQGFTIAHAPSRRHVRTLTLTMGLSGTLRAETETPGRSIVFRGAQGAVLRYSGLVATDRRGRVLSSSLELRHGDLLVHVDLTDASYPVRIDPLVAFMPKLTGTGEAGEGRLGHSVAVSADGRTAVVGAPGDNGQAGAAWVFTRSGGAWSEQAELKAGEGESGSGRFGSSVAVSANGAAVVVGAPGDSSEVGAAWVFKRSGTSWSQQGVLKAGEAESGSGQFGSGVALSANGSTALVGAPGDSGGVGAAWVFAHGETWSEQEELTAGLAESGSGGFGAAVALSGDGKTALLGAPGDSGGVGAAWVFAHGETWSEQEELTAGLAESGSGGFGAAVALSGDGKTALLGAPGDSGGVGAAWVFAHGETWSEQEELTAGEGDSGTGHLGSAVALSETGNTALAGAPGDSGGDGAAWLFSRSAGSWREQEELVGGKDESGAGLFGSGAGLSADGSTAVLGAPGDEGGAGAAWVYTDSPLVMTGSALAVTQSLAALAGSVDPNGGLVEECRFEYGPSTSYGSSVACAPAPGSGTGAVAVSGSVSGLAPNTSYHFRVVAVNAGGTSYGSDVVFKTLPDAPTVTSEAASFPPAQTSATLNGSVDPNAGLVEECRFEYGPSTSYGSSVACAPAPGSGTSAVEVSGALTGLAGATTYHFRIVATSAGGTSYGSDETVQTAPGLPAITPQAPMEVLQTSAIVRATVIMHGGVIRSCYVHVFDSGTPEREPVSTACVLPQQSGTVAASALVQELEPDTSYYFTVEVENTYGEHAFAQSEVFRTLPGPTVETGSASELTQTSVTLNATVNPNAGQLTSCELEYGTSVTYGSAAPCSPSSPAGDATVPVSAGIAGLAPDTLYHYRIFAANAGGSAHGADRTFTTLPPPPLVDTGIATDITTTSASLSATVNPDGGAVTGCVFEYGSSAAYGSSAPCTPSPGAGQGAVAVTASVAGLAPGTTYHYRIHAANPGGSSSGADRTFAAAPQPVPAPTPANTVRQAAPASCVLSLASTTVTILRQGWLAVDLTWSGADSPSCAGRLAFTYKTKGRSGRPKALTVAAGSFTLPPALITVVKVRMGVQGRALLSGVKGHVSAALKLIKLSPQPVQSQSRTVRLVPESRPAAKSKR